MEQMTKSMTPIGIKKTALEIISLVEILNLENIIFPPLIPHFIPKTSQYSVFRTLV
jgi:hypothetical protein